MKKLCLASLSFSIVCLFLIISFNSVAQSTNNKKNKDNVTKWYNSGLWLDGLQLKPDESINQKEFSKEYNANKIWWDEAFKFLRTNNLDSIKPGFYKIDDHNVYAMVSVGRPQEIDSIKWESHRHFNDLQYVVFGKVKMGSVPITEAKVTEPYNDKKDIAHYTVANAKYYIAEPGTFFIFSPEDVHKAGIRIDGVDSVKRIIIKVGTGR